MSSTFDSALTWFFCPITQCKSKFVRFNHYDELEKHCLCHRVQQRFYCVACNKLKSGKIETHMNCNKHLLAKAEMLREKRCMLTMNNVDIHLDATDNNMELCNNPLDLQEESDEDDDDEDLESEEEDPQPFLHTSKEGTQEEEFHRLPHSSKHFTTLECFLMIIINLVSLSKSQFEILCLVLKAITRLNLNWEEIPDNPGSFFQRINSWRKVAPQSNDTHTFLQHAVFPAARMRVETVTTVKSKKREIYIVDFGQELERILYDPVNAVYIKSIKPVQTANSIENWEHTNHISSSPFFAGDLFEHPSGHIYHHGDFVLVQSESKLIIVKLYSFYFKEIAEQMQLFCSGYRVLHQTELTVEQLQWIQQQADSTILNEEILLTDQIEDNIHFLDHIVSPIQVAPKSQSGEMASNLSIQYPYTFPLRHRLIMKERRVMQINFNQPPYSTPSINPAYATLPILKLMLILFIDDTGAFKTVIESVKCIYWTLGNYPAHYQSLHQFLEIFAILPHDVTTATALSVILQSIEPLRSGKKIWSPVHGGYVLVQAAIGVILTDMKQASSCLCIKGPSGKFGDRFYHMNIDSLDKSIILATARDANIDHTYRQILLGQKDKMTKAAFQKEFIKLGITEDTPILLDYCNAIGMDMYHMFPYCSLHALKLHFFLQLGEEILATLSALGRRELNELLRGDILSHASSMDSLDRLRVIGRDDHPSKRIKKGGVLSGFVARDVDTLMKFWIYLIPPLLIHKDNLKPDWKEKSEDLIHLSYMMVHLYYEYSNTTIDRVNTEAFSLFANQFIDGVCTLFHKVSKERSDFCSPTTFAARVIAQNWYAYEYGPTRLSSTKAGEEMHHDIKRFIHSNSNFKDVYKQIMKHSYSKKHLLYFLLNSHDSKIIELKNMLIQEDLLSGVILSNSFTNINTVSYWLDIDSSKSPSNCVDQVVVYGADRISTGLHIQSVDTLKEFLPLLQEAFQKYYPSMKVAAPFFIKMNRFKTGTINNYCNIGDTIMAGDKYFFIQDIFVQSIDNQNVCWLTAKPFSFDSKCKGFDVLKQEETSVILPASMALIKKVCYHKCVKGYKEALHSPNHCFKDGITGKVKHSLLNRLWLLHKYV